MPFTSDDLWFWHHFLINARLYLPFGNERAWLSIIPAFAHNVPTTISLELTLSDKAI
jgi:hypothetical protein